MRIKLHKDPNYWPEDQRVEWEERAAIMEFDGRLERAEAELEAEAIVRKKYGIPEQVKIPF